MINPIPQYFAGNENRAHSFGLRGYPCNNTLMKVSMASSSDFKGTLMQIWKSADIFDSIWK